MSEAGLVVIVTIPCPGHMIPATQLARYLLQRGLRVTCFTTGANFQSLERNLEAHDHTNARIRFHSLIDPRTEFTPPGRDLADTIAWMQRLGDAEMAARLDKALLGESISCLVSDLMVGWTQDVADKRAVPRHVLYTFPANALLFSLGRVLGVAAAKYPPGTWNSMEDATHAFYDYMMRNAARLQEAETILVNTFEALEEKALGVMRAEILARPDVQTRRILSVGPLIRSAIRNDHTPRASEIFQWLDAQEARSVLYVSFGSVLTITEPQVHELALGLERAGRPFLWVYRTPDSPQVRPEDAPRFDGLPAGFLERVEGRGRLIHGWAPQEQILAHVAVGAFLSHCGWNSSLEALWAGKPLIAWPLAVEQRLTARYFGSDLKIAVEVRKNNAGVVESAEVVRAVTTLLSDSASRSIRSRFSETHKLARQALEEPGGSSRKNLNSFVDSL